MNGALAVRREKNLQMLYHLIYPGAVLRILRPTLLDQFPRASGRRRGIKNAVQLDGGVTGQIQVNSGFQIRGCV